MNIRQDAFGVPKIMIYPAFRTSYSPISRMESVPTIAEEDHVSSFRFRMGAANSYIPVYFTPDGAKPIL
jgi:hypothetical protein